MIWGGRVSSNVLNIFCQEINWKGAWEEFSPSIEWNELRTIGLNISIEHTKHHPQSEAK
jgi:hypothetical protein